MNIPCASIIAAIATPIRAIEATIWNATHIYRKSRKKNKRVSLGAGITFSRYGSVSGTEASRYLRRFGVPSGITYADSNDFHLTVRAVQRDWAIGLLLGIGCEITCPYDPQRVKPIKPRSNWREGVITDHPQNAPTGDPRPGMQKAAPAKPAPESDIARRVKGFFS